MQRRMNLDCILGSLVSEVGFSVKLICEAGEGYFRIAWAYATFYIVAQDNPIPARSPRRRVVRSDFRLVSLVDV